MRRDAPGTTDRPGSVSFDRIADRYDATRGGDARAKHMAAALAPHLPPEGSVLEVGVGTGIVATALHYAVSGVDLSPAMAAHARSRLGPRVAVGDALRLPVRSGCLAAAYSVWVLHLVADVSRVLAEVGRALRPGGRYLIISAGSGVPQDGITDIVAPMYEQLLNDRGRQDDHDRVVALAQKAGLGYVKSVTCPPQEFFQSPAEVVARIEDRSGAAFWDVDVATWQAVVEPALRRLRALPRFDRPVRRLSVPTLAILEKT